MVEIRTPEGMAAGVYANGCGVWSTANDFTLDLLVGLPLEQGQHPETGEPVTVAPQQLVARVKIPPALVFQLMRNLNTAMEQYEQQHGSIPDFQGGLGPDGPPDSPSPELPPA